MNYSKNQQSGRNYLIAELRNCMLIMADKSFYDWMAALSEYIPFQNCICLSDNDLDEQYDKELVLRFFIFKNIAV